MKSLFVFITSLASAAAIALVPPSKDPFYVPPANLAEYAEGEIIRSRSVESLLTLPHVKSVKQVFYRTNNTQGEASHTVATLFTPQNPGAEPKLLSYQFWEDSNGIDCSPSYSISNSIFAPDGATAIIDFPIVADWAAENGYYLVAADHEGPRSAFIAGHEEGQAGLDGIRAAIHGLDLPEDVPIVLHGYSGGAHASAWIANLAERYAPELNIVGAAWGGTPVDVKDLVPLLDGSLFAGFVGAGFTGLLTAYPQYISVFDADVNAQFKSAISNINGSCLPTMLVENAFANFEKEVTVPDLWSIPAVVDIVGRESLLTNVSTLGVSVPTYPRYIYHAGSDEIVAYPPDQLYVEQQCAAGANIQFVTFPVGGHLTTQVLGLPGALIFIKQVFDGTTPQVTCGSSTPSLITADSPNLSQSIGSHAAASIKNLQGTWTPYGQITF